MKNIHILLTDKPSKLLKTIPKGNLILSKSITSGSHWENQNIYITNSEEIKEGDWLIDLVRNEISKANGLSNEDNNLVLDNGSFSTINQCKKIILTTDQDLIKDGVQAIDDDFLKWFVKNPSCESVEVIPLRKSSGWYDEKEVWHWDFLAYKIIIPKEEPKTNLEKLPFPKLVEEFANYYKKVPLVEEPKQETLEEAAESYAKPFDNRFWVEATFKDGAKWMQERMYSEEEVKQIIDTTLIKYSDFKLADIPHWFEQFKKK